MANPKNASTPLSINTPKPSISDWLRHNWLSVVTAIIALLAWWQPQWKAKDDKILTATIDDRITDNLNKSGLSKIPSELTGLTNKVDTLSDFVKILANSELGNASRLQKEKLKQELPQVGVAMSAAIAAESKIPSAVISSLSKAVGEVAKDSPDDPSVWKVAAQLVNYKSYESAKKSYLGLDSHGQPVKSPYCLEQHTITQFSADLSNEIPTDGPSIAEFGFTLHDCILVLDDLVTYDKSDFAELVVRRVDEVKQKRPNTTAAVNLTLVNVLVIYRGGNIIPVQSIAFHNCAFQLDPVSQLPAPIGRRYITQLLSSGDQKNILLKIPSSSPA